MASFNNFTQTSKIPSDEAYKSANANSGRGAPGTNDSASFNVPSLCAFVPLPILCCEAGACDNASPTRVMAHKSLVALDTAYLVDNFFSLNLFAARNDSTPPCTRGCRVASHLLKRRTHPRGPDGETQVGLTALALLGFCHKLTANHQQKYGVHEM